MKPKLLFSLLLLILSTLFFSVASASALDSYELDWWTVDGGSGTSQGGIYSLSGTIGQPDAGSASGGIYDLDSGFWVKGIQAVLDFLIHLPLVFK